MATLETRPPSDLAAPGISPPTPSSPNADLNPTAEQKELASRAQQFLAQERFHQSLTLPATDAHGELTVTYAVGGVESDSAPAVLFIGGLFGGRFLASMADYVARSLGMRFVVTDRPGMGGSTMVDMSLRLSVWLETVPVLMRAINAQHISVAAHSCGAIYALNTVHQLPWILPPRHRKLHLFAPWVGPDHAGVAMLSVASYLPSLLIDKFEPIVRLVNNTIMPTAQFVGALSGAVSSSLVHGDPGSNNSQRDHLPKHQRDELCLQYCGVSAQESAAQSKEAMRALFAESTRGASHDTLLCLRKGPDGSWGACSDYKTYPGSLESKMREYSEQINASKRETATADAFFSIQTFWAETDELISKEGEAYFDQCFAHYSESNNMTSRGDGHGHGCLLYESEVVPGTTHNTVFFPQHEALSRALGQIREQHGHEYA